MTLILFDLDGTLIDSRKDITDSVNRMLTSLNLPPKEESLIASFVGSGVTNLIRKSLGEEQESLFERALKIFRQDYDEHLLDHTSLYPDVRDVVETLARAKVYQAVITNKPLYFSEKILKGLAVRGYFHDVMGGDMDFPKKPAPDVVNYLAGKFGVEKAKILLVGDSVMDIQTGKNAGVKTCAVTYGFGERRTLEEAKPDYLIDTFGELLKIAYRS